MSQSSLLTTTSLLQLRKRKAATAPPLKPKSTAWAHVDHIGDSSYKCLGVGCNKIFKLTSVTRLENHITGNGSDIAACLHPITEIRDVLLAKFEAKGVVKKSKVKVGASPSGHGAVGDLFGAARNYSTQEQCDEKFGAAVLLNTLPYSMLTKPEWQEAVDCVRRLPPSVQYVLPNGYKVSEPILRNLHEKSAQSNHAIHSDEGLVLTVTSDGWNSIERKPVINICIVSRKGSCFRKLIDVGAQSKDATYTAGVLVDAIDEIEEEYGVGKVVAICMDNASVCKAAQREVRKRKPKVMVLGCVLHAISLLFKDICMCSDMCKSLIQVMRMVARFVRGHDYTNARIEELTLADGNISKKIGLILPGETRFASNYFVAERCRRRCHLRAS